MIHEEIEHNIVPRRYVGASNRLPLRSRVIFSALLFIISVSATLLFNGYGLVGLIATHYMVVCAFFLCVFFQFMLASDPRCLVPAFDGAD